MPDLPRETGHPPSFPRESGRGPGQETAKPHGRTAGEGCPRRRLSGVHVLTKSPVCVTCRAAAGNRRAARPCDQGRTASSSEERGRMEMRGF